MAATLAHRSLASTFEASSTSQAREARRLNIWAHDTHYSTCCRRVVVVAFTATVSSSASGAIDRHADGDAVPDRSGRGAGWRRDRVGVEQQRRAQHPDRRPSPAPARCGPPITSGARSQLHRRRRAVDHRAGLHERRARRSSTCAATAPIARASRRIPRSCRTAPIRRCSRSAVAGGAPKRLGPGSGVVAVAARTARRVGVARTDLERRSRDHRCAGAARQRARQRVGLVVVARRIDARVHQRPRHAQLHRRVHARIEGAALHRSVARSRRQRGVVAGRIDASRGSARARRRGRACFRLAAKSTNRGRCAWPT